MTTEERTEARRRRVYWILLGAFVFAGIAILLAALSCVVLAWREGARRERCDANLARLYAAVVEYCDANGTYPPAFTIDESGRKLHSWRVLLLPYLGESTLYEQIRLDEPWDGDWNRQFADKTPSVFQCSSTPTRLFATAERCAYSAALGESTAFPKDGRAVAPGEIVDGLSNTLLFVERKRPVCWLDPDADLTEETVLAENAKPNRERVDFGSWHGAGETAVFCDGSRRFLSEKLDANVLKLLLKIDDSAAIPSETAAEPNAGSDVDQSDVDSDKPTAPPETVESPADAERLND